MPAREDSRRIKKIKSDKRLRQLRKQTLLTSNKAIRLQQLRWLRGAISTKFPRGLSAPAALKRLYTVARSKLAVQSGVNYLFSRRLRAQTSRFSRTNQLSIRARCRAIVKRLRSYSERKPRDPSNRQLAASRLLTFAQKRRALTTARALRALAVNVRSTRATKKFGGRRRYLRRQGQQLNLLIKRSLLRPTARKLFSQLSRAKRFARDKGQRLHQDSTFGLNDTRANLTSARQEAQQLSAAVLTTAPLPATTILVRKLPRASNKHPRSNYQQALSRVAFLAGRLQALKTSSNHSRSPRSLSNRGTLTAAYSRNKELLRSRFFYRHSLTQLLASSIPTAAQTRTTNLPTYAQANLYKYKISTGATDKQGLGASASTVVGATRTNKFRKILHQFLPVAVIPLSAKLAAAAAQFCARQTTRNTRRTLLAFSKQSTATLRLPRRSTRRLKKAILAVQRKNKKISKGEQKRCRLGIRRPKTVKKLTGVLPKKARTQFLVNWSSAATRLRRAQILRGLGAFSLILRNTVVLRRHLGVSNPGTQGHLVRQKLPVRNALWALFRAAAQHRDLLMKAPRSELLAAEVLLRKLRRALRSGVYQTKGITAGFLFLLSALPVASVEQKKLSFAFQRWQKRVDFPKSSGAYSEQPLKSRSALEPTLIGPAQRQLRAKLFSNPPRLLTLPQLNPEEVSISLGRKLPSPEITPCAPEFTGVPTSSTSNGASNPPSLVEGWSIQHSSVLIPAYTQQKKRRITRVAKRKSRFVRFIPKRIKNRLLRSKAVSCNQISLPTAYVPVPRYGRQFYTKGNRIFVSARNSNFRITAKWLQRSCRWSRSSLLRLSRRRPSWTRVPKGRQIMSSTGRAATQTPYVGGGKGWRARKNRIKNRNLLRKQAEQFKKSIQQANATSAPTVFNARVTAAPRVLGLITTGANQAQLPHGQANTVVSLASITAFHAAQQQLLLRRASRAVPAKAAFTKANWRVSGGLYTRRQGKFILAGNRRRKHPRKPRAVRLLSSTSARAINFMRLNPKLISLPRNNSSTPSNTDTVELRYQLWAGIGRYHPTLKPKTGTDQKLLAKQLHRLYLIKKLLLGNKFSKLSRLGELNALGEYKYLENLGKLFALGFYSNELKQQLLLKLAAAIKLCATRCVTKPSTQLQHAVTKHVAPRVLVTYRKPPVIFGRDPEFFFVTAAKKIVTNVKRVQKLALLKVLAQRKNKKFSATQVTGALTNPFLTRAARTRRLTSVLRLRRYRAALLSRATVDLSATSSRTEQLGLLWKRARSRRRWLTSPAPGRSVSSKAGAEITKDTAVRFLPLSSLLLGYTKIPSVVTTPEVWVSRLGHWVRGAAIVRTARLPRVGALPKAFSAARPWGVKTVYTGGIAKGYGRLLAGVRAELSSLKRPTSTHTTNTKGEYMPLLTAIRLSATRVVQTQSGPKALQFAPYATGSKFWQLRRQSRDQVRMRAELRFRALNFLPSKAAPHWSKIAGRPATALRRTGKMQSETLTKKAIVTQELKPKFRGYRIRGLNITVFAPAVHRALEQFSNLSPTEQVSQPGYDLVRRAYKVALSSQESNPELLRAQFEAQRASVAAILTRLAGVAPESDVALEWKQLPKNKVAPRPVTAMTFQAGGSSSLPTTGELTAAEIEGVRDEATRKYLKLFSAISPVKRQNNPAFLLVKKAVLHSWTKVEEANTPKESVYYSDLLLAAKAYGFYGVTLDLTSRAATNTKLVSTFAKLPK